MQDRTSERHRMVAEQIEARGIRDPHVLDAMRRVPREDFVDPAHAASAHADHPLPIGEGQTISQPYIVAAMLEAAEIRPGQRVLDVGAGSGYAAAVASRIADQVFAIERLPGLADSARRRLARLGYDNIQVRQGDGTRGWPEAAPFDAILVAASGPVVPEALKRQLRIGGRLVLPVGERSGAQRLRRIRRLDEDAFAEDDLGAVAFVPLVGAAGWSDAGRHPAPAVVMAALAEPFGDLDDDFAALFDRFADRRVVLLGEASHGTAEFYRARAAITRRLVQRHGFTVVALEADWPDAAALDRRVRGGDARPSAPEGEPPFQRFPRWMWRNAEFEAFIDWLRHENAARPQARRAGVYGLDLYSLSASMAEVLRYLDRVDPEAAAVARQRYGCLSRWADEPAAYGSAVRQRRYESCEQAVVAQCRDMLDRQGVADPDSVLDAEQNARLVSAAERYYRIMYHGGSAAWNLRDRHMFETLTRILDARGPDARAVVWAHNSHIGDARQTAMSDARGELNLGQLCRERFGGDAALIGFGTHAGTVAAARDWEGEMEVRDIRPALPGSWEEVCHDTAIPRFLADFHRNAQAARDLPERLSERFIGVIYRPETERQSHYLAASLPRQFDAWVWIDRTTAVTPTEGPQAQEPAAAHSHEVDTFPTGL